MIVIIFLCATLAVLLGAWSTSTVIAQRQGTQRSLRAVGAYGALNVREQELGSSVAERVLVPIGKGVVGLGRRLTPVGYVESVERKIVHAGSPAGFAVDRFIAAKVLAIGSVPLGILVFNVVLGIGGLFGFVLVAALGAACFLAPDLVLQNKISNRKTAIERELPDTLDLLVISVEAGLGFEQALDRTASAVPGPLSDESRRMLHEIRMGASRADALRALDQRTDIDDLRSFILAMLQADNFGISISRILKSQADEMRIRRRQNAQERAQKMPIKMLFPLVFCIFPAIFVVVLLPAMLTIVDALA